MQQEQAKRYQMKKIRLELARAGSAEGSPNEGYVFVAPLDSYGHISLEGWRHEKGLCFAHRIEGGEVAEQGLLVHRARGGAMDWVFEFGIGAGEEDEGFRFGSHAFVPNEYVSVRDAGGAIHTYRIAAVEPA